MFKKLDLNKKLVFFISFLFLIILLIFAILVSHFGYLWDSSSDKSIDSFLFNAKMAFIDFKNIVSNNFLVKPIDVNKIDISIFKLFIKEDKIDYLNSKLPKLDYFGPTAAPKEHVGGYFSFGDEQYRVDVRYRGNNYFHWRFPKKSWRVELENKTLFDDYNRFNIINPKDNSHMDTQLSYLMAENLSLISPRSYYVALFINNLYGKANRAPRKFSTGRNMGGA